MKANTKYTNRILTTAGILLLAVSISYSQGLLAEGAMKLIKLNKSTVETAAPEYTLVGYKEVEKGMKMKNFFNDLLNSNEHDKVAVFSNRAGHISHTIMVNDLSVSYESEIETENWMLTPISNQIESELTTEAWMETSFTEGFEAELEIESWMTEPFTGSVESEITVENWMTRSFTEDVENELTTEEWMIQPLATSFEKELEVEEWMTQPFETVVEDSLVVEEWMTEIFASN